MCRRLPPGSDLGLDSVCATLTLSDVQSSCDRVVVKEVLVDCGTLMHTQFTADVEVGAC